MKIKKEEKVDSFRIKIVELVAFLLGFSNALVIYVLSSYFKLSSGFENVTVFYFISFVVVLIIFLNLHKVIGKIGKTNVFYLIIFLKIIVIFFLSILNPGWTTVFFLIFYVILWSVAFLNLDLILESCSADKMSGRIRGLHLTIMELGYILGPFLATRILGTFGFNGIFFLLLIVTSVILIISIVGIKNINHNFSKKFKIKTVISKIIRLKDIRRIYYVSFILEFFYSLIIIYCPIYLRDIGLSWDEIGIIFTLMLLPFILLQYPLGFLADKKTGEKEFLLVGVLIMGMATTGIYFIGGKSVAIWSMILFATRVGAAIIQILKDSYFYKRVDGADVDIIDFYRTSVPMANIFSTSIATFVLFFFPIKSVFLLIGGVVLSAIFPIMKLNDSKCETENRKIC